MYFFIPIPIVNINCAFLHSFLYDFLINATGKFTYREPHHPPGWDGWGLFLIQYFLIRGFAPGKLFRPLSCGPSILVTMDHNYTIRPQPCGPFILVCMDHLWSLPLMLWTFYSSQVDHNHTLIFSTMIRSINS